jgi:hypothetical protein
MRGISWLATEPVSFSRRTLLHGVSKYVWQCDIYIRHFADFWKVTIIFYVAARPSVRPHQTTWPPLDGYSQKLILSFSKTMERIHVWLKSDKNTSMLYRDRRIFITSGQTLLTETLPNEFKPNLMTHIMLTNLCHFWDNVEKYSRTGQGSDGNIIRCIDFSYCLHTSVCEG